MDRAVLMNIKNTSKNRSGHGRTECYGLVKDLFTILWCNLFTLIKHHCCVFQTSQKTNQLATDLAT